MKNHFLYFKALALIIIVVTMAQGAHACTAVFINKGNTRIVGRNLDWPTGQGFVFINPANVDQKAAFLQDKSQPAAWKSKYTSATFNIIMNMKGFIGLLMKLMPKQVAQPLCGINEKGFYAGGFWIHPPPAVKYPSRDGRPTINDWQLTQYFLDNFQSVKEAVDNIDRVRVAGFSEGNFNVDLHWFLADASGDSAIIEFPDGKISIHHPAVPPAITNNFYESSRDYLKAYVGFGGKKSIPTFDRGEFTSYDRLLVACSELAKAKKENKLTIADAFAIMKDAAQNKVRHLSTSQSMTQWTMAYDLNKREVNWFSQGEPQIKTIKFSELALDKLKKPLTIDVNTKLAGDVSGQVK
jgi:penicillin V acylase-like amidase (Ntn superfamily)